MKKLLLILLVFTLFNCKESDDTVIASEYVGKWEVISFRLSSEPSNVSHTLPYTISGTTINSGGYEVENTNVKVYVNGIIAQTIKGLYSDGNSFYNSDGASGISVQLSNNGNNCTVTTLQEIDYCKKVSKFSWE